MSTLHFHHTTISTPEQFLAALVDFGPSRSKLFGNSADEDPKVYHRGPSDAGVASVRARFLAEDVACGCRRVRRTSKQDNALGTSEGNPANVPP